MSKALHNSDEFLIKTKQDIAFVVQRIIDQRDGNSYFEPKILSERELKEKNHEPQNSSNLQTDISDKDYETYMKNNIKKLI